MVNIFAVTAELQPEIREGEIWARRATDNKGQMMAHVLGVEKTLREYGKLSGNWIFCLKAKKRSVARVCRRFC